jgi:glutamyl-tRNA synthetase/glutamyl-Q tRNA(Asp) synthetase
VLLRIEDHDRARSRSDFESKILDDLQWLGFVSDDVPVRQSDRVDLYGHALDALRRKGLVYACRCSRAQITAATRGMSSGSGETTVTDELWYPGTCRGRDDADECGAGVRIQLEPSTETFLDLRHGLQAQRPFEQCGDLLARDRDGHWTYQFAAAVDDYAQGITLVIRGDDLLASTGRQIQVARLLGRAEPPRFLHHALVMKSATQKLSKSDRDTGIRELRARGWSAPQVIGHACFLAGLCAAPRDVAADEVSSMMGGFKEALS